MSIIISDPYPVELPSDFSALVLAGKYGNVNPHITKVNYPLSTGMACLHVVSFDCKMLMKGILGVLDENDLLPGLAGDVMVLRRNQPDKFPGMGAAMFAPGQTCFDEQTGIHHMVGLTNMMGSVWLYVHDRDYIEGWPEGTRFVARES